MSSHSSKKAIFTAFFANLLIAISKLIGYLVTFSSSMLSEAIHSFADCANQILLLIGSHRASKAADSKYHFGHGKEEFLYSFLVAIILFTFGAIFSIYEGVHHILHPEKIKNVSVVLITLFFAFFLELYSLYQALKAKGSDVPLLKYIQKTTDSSSVVVLIEDSAALVGLGFSFTAILLAYFVNPIFDGIGALITGLILGWLSIVLAIELGKLLKGEGLSLADSYKVKSNVLKLDLVETVNSVQSTVIGNNKYLILVSVNPYDFSNGKEVEEISQTIKDSVLVLYPNSLIYVDFANIE